MQLAPRPRVRRPRGQAVRRVRAIRVETTMEDGGLQRPSSLGASDGIQASPVSHRHLPPPPRPAPPPYSRRPRHTRRCPRPSDLGSRLAHGATPARPWPSTSSRAAWPGRWLWPAPLLHTSTVSTRVAPGDTEEAKALSR
ncbi:hypothetical protein ACQJBY_063930 [Aegilops geniculata]